MGRTTTISSACYVFRPYFVFAALIISFCCSLPTLSQPDKIVRIESVFGVAQRDTYLRELLFKALNVGLPPKEHIEIKECYEGPGISSARKAVMLIKGRYDLIWAPPRLDLEKKALRVNYPVLRGLRGYRIMFVHKGTRAKLARVRDKEGLAKLVSGLGIGWTDVDVFIENSLPTLTAPTHADLWRMLDARRFDYYPRGLSEIHPEWAQNHKRYPSIAIDQSLVVHYPFPMFFYVRAGRPDLHDRLTKNMKKLYESGEFLELWIRKHQTLIKELKFANRTIIQLKTSHTANIKGWWPEHIMVSPEELKRLSQ